MMAYRTKGNSATALHRQLDHLHFTKYLTRVAAYVTALKQRKMRPSMENPRPSLAGYRLHPAYHAIPRPRWFSQAYVRQVYYDLPIINAQLTSPCGSILKMDSSRKVANKLAGEDVGSALWATTVGNEIGQILISVLTASEGAEGLQAMADGLQRRYKLHGEAPPKLLYIDRDCCGKQSDANTRSVLG